MDHHFRMLEKPRLCVLEWEETSYAFRAANPCNQLKDYQHRYYVSSHIVFNV
jgi:hypothetical protein